MLKSDLSKSLKDEVIRSLRGPVKVQIKSYLEEAFRSLAEDYQAFINPVSELERSQVDNWVAFFIDSFERDYDSSINTLISGDTGLSLDISFMDEEKLGFNTDDNSSPIHWVYFYINGQRNNSFFLSAKLLEYFLDTKNLPSGNPAVRLINDALQSRVGEFGDGFLLTSYEFNAPNDQFEGVRWSDLFSEEEVTPGSSTQEHENFLETVSTDVGEIIREAIDKILSGGKL